MKVPTHVIGHYYKSVRRYRKIIARIKKLQFELRFAFASSVPALTLTASPPDAQTNNGPFTIQLMIQVIDGLSVSETIKGKAYYLIL